MLRPCQQKKCALLGTSLCPVCKECGAKPNVIDENCVTCWNCERDEGHIRGQKGKGSLIEITIAQPVENQEQITPKRVIIEKIERIGG